MQAQEYINFDCLKPIWQQIDQKKKNSISEKEEEEIKEQHSKTILKWIN